MLCSVKFSVLQAHSVQCGLQYEYGVLARLLAVAFVDGVYVMHTSSIYPIAREGDFGNG